MRSTALFSLIVLLLAACSDDRRVDTWLDTADSLSVVHPDSALLLLDSPPASLGISHADAHAPFSTRQAMRRDLLRARAMNKAYVPFTTDSMMTAVARYYDRHGSPNEQMEAHYLLGCVYRDLGEAPRAIESFLDAAAKADTTASDCKYGTLGKIYSQMANMFHRQLLLSDEVDARKQAYRYTLMSGDTLAAINDFKMMASAYILQNKNDSAENVLKEAMQLYRKHGYLQNELKASTMLMYLYIGQPSKIIALKDLIDRYEADCALFDENHELPPSKRQYYYYKGRYFEGVNQLDSAEHYYRKSSRPNMSFTDKDPMYRGLLSVFQKKHEPDSIAKFAALFTEANDSSIVIKDQELTAQMAASYNYNRYQRQALENAERVNQRLFLMVILLSAAIIGMVTTLFFWKQYRNKRKALEQAKREYAETRDNCQRIQLQLQQLDEKHKEVIKAIKKEHAESQGIISLLHAQHEEEKSN